MENFIRKPNYNYECKIDDISFNIRLFLIEKEKIEININTTNSDNEDYAEYSNIYTLNQLEEISRYFSLFKSIEEAMKDILKNIQNKNFSINKNGNTLTLSLKLMYNSSYKNVNLILDKVKLIDLYTKKQKNNSNSNSQEKGKLNKNVAITSIKELNYLLTNFKDRILFLEKNGTGQNKKEKNTKISGKEGGKDLLKGLEKIISKINRLETENNSKDQMIEKLENKLKYYESGKNYNNTYKNTNKNNNNNTNKNTVKSSLPSYDSLTTSKININSDGNNLMRKYNNLESQKQINLNIFNGKNSYLNKSPRKNTSVIKNKQNVYSKSDNREYCKTIDNCFNNNMNYIQIYNRKQSIPKNNKIYRNYDEFSNLDNSISISNYNNISNISLFSTLKDKSFIENILIEDKYGIPMVRRELDLKNYINSRIFFTRKELKLLKSKLRKGQKKTHVYFDLIYRASVDGDFEDIVKLHAGNKLKTLTLFYTYEGARFGVYMNRKKADSMFKEFEEVPGTSFIVSLNNLVFFDVMENKISKTNFNNLLCFGSTYYCNKNGSNWLIYTPSNNFLKRRVRIGNRISMYKYFNPELLIGNKVDYHLKDVEIFNVVFEKGKEN